MAVAAKVPVAAILLLMPARKSVAAVVVVERLLLSPIQTVVSHLAIVASSAGAPEAEVAKVVAASDINNK